MPYCALFICGRTIIKMLLIMLATAWSVLFVYVAGRMETQAVANGLESGRAYANGAVWKQSVGRLKTYHTETYAHGLVRIIRSRRYAYGLVRLDIFNLRPGGGHFDPCPLQSPSVENKTAKLHSAVVGTDCNLISELSCHHFWKVKIQLRDL